jgi:hypothetical protein
VSAVLIVIGATIEWFIEEWVRDEHTS